MTNLYIKYPEMRNEIVQSLKWLADKNVSNCIDTNYPHSFWDNLRYPIGNLLDDFNLDKNTEEHIGITLYDENECKVIRQVAIYLNKLVQEVGGRQPDQAYLQWHLWEVMAREAEEALKVLDQNNHKYNYIYKDL